MNDKSLIKEINKEVFTDSFQASLVAEDCKQLLSTSIENVEELKNQKWYSRLWKTISGGNIQSLAKQAKTTQEAQLLLLNVLRESQADLERTNHLVYLVTKGLEHVELKNEKIVIRLNYLRDDLADIREDVKHTRDLIDVDPLDEYTWKEEDKVLLLKVIIVTSLIDEIFHEWERELLLDRINSFELSEPAYKEVLEYKGELKPIIVEIEHLDSYKMKKVLYKYAVATAYVHDDISNIEKSFLKNLAKVLHLKDQDIQEVNNYFGLIETGDVESILERIEGNRSRSRSRLKKKLREKEEKRKEQKREKRKEEAKKKNLIAEIESVGPEWVDAYSRVFAYTIVMPTYEYYEFVENAEVENMDELMELWSGENLINYYNQRIHEIIESINLEESISDLKNHIKLEDEQEWLESQSSLFQYCMQNDAGWEDQLGVLERHRTNFMEKYGSETQDWIKNIGWGAAAGFLGGPVGVMAAVGASYFAEKSRNEKVEEALMQVANEYERIVSKTDDWLESCYENSYEFFYAYLQSVCEAIQEQPFSKEFNNIPAVLKRETNEMNEAFEE